MSDSKTQTIIGVDIGATTIKSGLVDHDGNILYKNRFPTEASAGPEAVLQQTAKSIRDVIEQTNIDHPGVIGVGTPGIVDGEGNVKSPPNFTAWESLPLAKRLKEMIGFDFIVENDANAAALGESTFGAGKEFPDFLFVIWGTGVGGGIILNRKIFRGPSGGAGEIGHISIDHKGPKCNCGNRGCVEAYVGQKYLSQRTAEMIRSGRKSVLTDYVEGDLSRIEPLLISKAAKEKDPLAQEMFSEAAYFLGVAIASVMNMLDLRISIVGGGISAAGDDMIDIIRRSVQERVLSPLRPDIRILRATLGNDAGILGAASLVMQGSSPIH